MRDLRPELCDCVLLFLWCSCEIRVLKLCVCKTMLSFCECMIVGLKSMIEVLL